MKVRFDIHVTKAVGAFASTDSSLRILWKRGDKVQVSAAASIAASSVQFNAHLSQLATLHKDAEGKLEQKHFTFKLQSVSDAESGKPKTIGKAQLELSQFTSTDSAKIPMVIPLTTCNPQIAKALELHFEISSTMVKGIKDEDQLSEVSVFSTGTSNSLNGLSPEQDLTGFYSLDSRSNSQKIGTLRTAASTDLSQSYSQDSDKLSVLSSPKGVVLDVAFMQSKINKLTLELMEERKQKAELQLAMDKLKQQTEKEMSLLKKELEDQSKASKEGVLKSKIGPYEIKYNSLLEDYKELLFQSDNDVNGLQEEVLDLRDHVAKLEGLLETNERIRETLVCEKRALEMSLIGSSTAQIDMDNERRELRQELNQADNLMKELIQTKMNFAELSEKHTISCHEVRELKEKNLQLASKLTSLEIMFYRKRRSTSMVFS